MLEWIEACLAAMGTPIAPEDRIARELEDLQKERRQVADRLWQLRLLRGADSDAQMIAGLRAIDAALAVAAQAASRPSEASLREARLRLDEASATATQVQSRSHAITQAAAADLAAMPAYYEALERTRAARDEVAGLVGARPQLDQLDTLLARGQAAVAPDGSGGYTGARAILAGHAAILSAARDASRTFEARLDPQLVTRREAVRAKLAQHRLVAPDAQTRLHEEALARALARADEGVAVADAAMAAVGEQISDEVLALREAKTAAEQLLAHVGDWLTRLAAAGVPTARRAPYQHLFEAARDQHIPERDHPRATTLLTEVLRACEQLQTEQDRQTGQWTEHRQQIEKIRTFALGIRKDMPQFRAAHLVIEQADAMLAAHERGDLDEAVGQLPELRRRHDALRDEVVAAKGAGSVQDMVQARTATRQALAAKTAGLERKLAQLDERVGPEIAAIGTTVRRRVGVATARLEAMLGNPCADYVTALADVRTEVFAEFDTIGMEIDQLLRGGAALQQVIDDGNAEVGRQQDLARPGRIATLLRELPRYQVDVAAERAEHDRLLPQVAADAAAAILFERLEQRLSAKLAQAKEAYAKKVAEDLERITRIEAGLARLAASQPDWQPWFDELKLQCDDVRALVASGDPKAHDAAVAECAELVGKMKSVDPQYRAADAKSFADVEAKQAALAKQLGKGDLVQSNLATTYATLRADLEKAIATARAASPDEGLRILAAIEPRITQALVDAAAMKVRRDAFAQRRKDLATRWQRLQSAVGMRFTDRAESFAARFEARSRDAAETAKQEGELAKAEAELAKLEAELLAIETAGDDATKRRALQDKDAAAAAELRSVADMVQRFEAERSVFETKTIPALEQAVKGRTGIDNDQLVGLRQSGKHAATIVQRYLDAHSLLPHRRLTGEKAPDPAKAAADFARARKILTDATALAQGLAKGESTNAWYSGDLERVAGEWPRATRGYKLALEEMATAMTAAVAGEPDDVVTRATSVAGRLRKLADLLPPTAFATVVDEVTAATTKDARLAARERGLAVVRRHRESLLKHPLLVAANDAGNPFRNALREAGIVRATLKKLELEFLGIS